MSEFIETFSKFSNFMSWGEGFSHTMILPRGGFLPSLSHVPEYVPGGRFLFPLSYVPWFVLGEGDGLG